MKLQQIKLAGFKSFVDPTTIEVNGQLVGIVGPNGCGKSNVIDAVRWVLGESSAKQLRGESMQDVIFSGSIKRKAVSRATVELVFDNSLKSLHGLWNSYNEIAIKRLISRQGESYYYINNQQVRRKDIADLFLGTGVGTKGYAVIEQGMISRIIESKPEEMRLFIEEAAGVSKYRERRRETILRLNDTAENLQRLEDIHSEITQQLGSLQEQAEVATRYQELQCELKRQQSLQLAIKISDASRILTEANQFIKHGEDELRILGYQLEEVNLALQTLHEDKHTQEQLLQELVQKFNDYRTSLARVEERYKHYSDLLRRFETESVELGVKHHELELEIEDLTLQSQVIQEKIAENQIDLSEQGLVREQQLLLLESKQQLYDEVAAASSQRQSKLNNFKHALDLLQNSLRHKEQQHANLKTRLARLAEEGRTLDFDQGYHFIQQEIERVVEDIARSETNNQAKQLELEQLQRLWSAQSAEVAQQQQQLAASNATITTLEQLLHAAKSATTPAELWHGAEPCNELWQLIQVTPGYEVAVEVALAGLLQAKILDDICQLNGVPEQPLSICLRRNELVEPAVGTLSSVVKLNDPALSGIYHHLNRYQLLGDWREGRELMAEDLALTIDGHLLSSTYLIFHANTRNRDNLLQQQQQLNQEGENNCQLQSQLGNLEQDLAISNAKLTTLNNDLASLSQLVKRLNLTKHDLQLEFTKQEQIYLQNQRHQERVSQESSLIQQEIEHLSGEIEELSIQLEDQQIASEELQLASQSIELNRLDHEVALGLAKSRLQDFDAKANQLIIDNQLLKQQKLNALNLIDEKRLQLAAASHKLTALNNERISFNNNDQAAEISQLQQQIAAVTAEMHQVQQVIDQLSSKVILLKNRAGALNNSYQRNLEKVNQTKFKQQEQQILLSTYQESRNGLGLEPWQLEELLQNNSATLAELGKSLKQLEEQIEGLGLVNLKAIQDLNLASAKEQDLLKQLGDLRAAAEMLQQAILHIDGETRKLLQQTFDQLNQAIVVYFKTLFGGGDARLALSEKDILVAGVQIFAEPPGKKNSTIHLLSGGEKALAAMSFIFALFSLNPAPFCLLDEVDAPLDDANTGRFCKLVQELSAKTQFVYISHNRLAMEMADQLVGVTMQEKGVSTTVSVSLIDAVKQAQLAIEE